MQPSKQVFCLLDLFKGIGIKLIAILQVYIKVKYLYIDNNSIG